MHPMSERIAALLKNKDRIHEILLCWFTENQRDLPWRMTYDPYQVWISEIMGQQTQMDRVVEYFRRWMELFPDVAAVAAATQQQILKVWEGLGYYSRARNIHQTAKILVEQHGGVMPRDKKVLLSLPGIGPYTASAILSIAYNRSVSLLDANVSRLFVRLLNLSLPVKQAQAGKILQKMAEELLLPGQARQFNQALMEFGALICKPKVPQCHTCPLTKYCQAYCAGTVADRPVVLAKKSTIDVVMVGAIIVRGGKVYIQQRMASDVWGGLWEFPGGRIKAGETPEQAVYREVCEETQLLITRVRPYAIVVHHYTRYRVTLHGFVCRLFDPVALPVLHTATQYAWVPLAKIAEYPFSAGHRQLVHRLCSGKKREY